MSAYLGLKPPGQRACEADKADWDSEMAYLDDSSPSGGCLGCVWSSI